MEYTHIWRIYDGDEVREQSFNSSEKTLLQAFLKSMDPEEGEMEEEFADEVRDFEQESERRLTNSEREEIWNEIVKYHENVKRFMNPSNWKVLYGSDEEGYLVLECKWNLWGLTNRPVKAVITTTDKKKPSSWWEAILLGDEDSPEYLARVL